MESKVVFITGGASGIGLATVKKFISEGWHVIYTDLHPAPEKLDADFLEIDSRAEGLLELAVKAVIDKYGHIDALFCNSGIHRCNTILDITDSELNEVIQTNIYGTIYTIRAVAPYMVKAGKGSIVLNDSDQFFVGKPNSFAYGLTKGAIGQMTRSLAIDLGEYGIRVNAVCAGTIRTPLVDKLFDKFAQKEGLTLEEYWEKENKNYARGRAGEASEVAEVVFFLASDKASFCTGSHYLCDGGLVCK